MLLRSRATQVTDVCVCVCVCVCARARVRALSWFSRVRLCATLWTVACQVPLSIGFSRQEYWSGLPCPSPGYLLNPGIKPRSPAFQVDSLPAELPGKSLNIIERKKESEVAQLCPTLCDPMDCKLPRSSVHEIFQTRVLEWVAISFSRESSQTRD